MKSKTSKICPTCGKSFNPWWSGTKFCSRKCSGTERNGKVIQKCQVCGKEREVFASKGNRKFCGYKCAYIGRKHEISKDGLKRISDSKRGSRNSNWKGGVTREDSTFYCSKKWKEIATTCKERDNFTCQRCFKSLPASKLRAHHIIYRANGGSDSIDNLITYCNPCHRKIHYYDK